MTSTVNSGERRVIVIGGGVSGLSCSYFLSEAGIPVTLVEKSNRLGGLIRTDLIESSELEAGPDSFIAAKPSVLELAKQLGIEDQIIGSNDARRRIFIARNSSLVPMPPGMVMMVPGDLRAALRSDLFGFETKFRFVEEIFFAPRTREADVSLREFVSDHFGPESLESVTEPLLAGVYGGDAAALSTQSVLPRFLDYERKYGSLIRAVRRERSSQSPHASLFLSFRGGMQTLTDALARAISSRVRIITGEVHEIERVGEGWRVRMSTGSADAAHLVLACPAHINAKLIRTPAPSLSGQLRAIPYSSAILVTLVYDRQQLGHPLDGFGFLVPQRERQPIAAATWISTKFPSRTPADRAAIRAFLVGKEAIEFASQSEGKIILAVRTQLERLMGIAATPLASRVNHWPDSMPQYVVGHAARQKVISTLLDNLPGLHLCGNAYDGVGIPDCIRLAREVSRSIL